MVMEAIRKLKFKLTPENRHILVVLDGTYKGEWLVQIYKIPQYTVYLSLPDRIERIIPDKDIKWGLDNKVIEKAGIIPKKVYNVCLAEYENAKRNNTSDRREQHASSRALGRNKYKQALSELQRSRNRDAFRLLEDNKSERNNV